MSFKGAKMPTTFSSDDVAPASRFSYVCAAVRETVVPLTLNSANQQDYWGEVVYTDFADSSVSRLSGMPTVVDRTTELIRESDPDVYQVQMHVRGTSGISQDGQQVCIRPGDVVIFDPGRPYRAWVGYGPTRVRELMPTGPVQVVNVMLPRGMLPLRGPRDEVARARLSCRNPMNSLAAAVMEELDVQHAAGNEGVVARLLPVVAELLTIGVAQQLGGLAEKSPETRERALLWSVHNFIEANLADPELSPDVIAAAHNISPRWLQRLLQGEGDTPAGRIRRRRVEQCRRDLLDPALRDKPAAAIGFRWGFRDAAHFTRVFKAAYGSPPGAYREQHLGGVRAQG